MLFHRFCEIVKETYFVEYLLTAAAKKPFVYAVFIVYFELFTFFTCHVLIQQVYH